ncbi:hypothetical protein KUTeg_024438 [Tegillarca granosa]|uniref:Uncharacterized protein n=1 Tax=Tegillarca granosa TaxID=220873 RepID=A0ABQ9DY24_TEGGR|nr:hypothetical protein KUTeg_024438 [Tegillarca granosa]
MCLLLHDTCLYLYCLKPQEAYELITKRLHNLPDRDANEILAIVKAENPQSYEETVEVMMIGLRKLCENRQREHTHISDHNKNTFKTEFNILESKVTKASSAFDSLKNKCKKSLATSFETLLSRDSSATSTPEASPLPSPAFPIKDTSFHFPSPPSSPQPGRPRSSTVGAIPDPKLASRYSDTGHLDKTPHTVDFREHATRRSSTNSPMKQM